FADSMRKQVGCSSAPAAKRAGRGTSPCLGPLPRDNRSALFADRRVSRFVFAIEQRSGFLGEGRIGEARRDLLNQGLGLGVLPDSAQGDAGFEAASGGQSK